MTVQATFNNDKYQLRINAAPGGAFLSIWHQPADDALDQPAAVIYDHYVVINEPIEEPAPRLPPECLRFLQDLSARCARTKSSGQPPTRPSVAEVDRIAQSLGFNLLNILRPLLS